MTTEEAIFKLLLPGIVLVVVLIVEDFIFGVFLKTIDWIKDAARRFL